MPKRRRSDSGKKKGKNTEEELIPTTYESDEEIEKNEQEEVEEVEEGKNEEAKFVPFIEPYSDEEEVALDENTVGDVPMHWYDEYDHIGYNILGQKIARPERKDQLDSFLDREENKNWRTVWDEKNQKQVVLSKEEMKILRNIQKKRFPESNYNPYQPFIDIPNPDLKIHPLLNTPEPKSRFVPSKWEAKRIAYLVKAIRKGWIKLDKKDEEIEPLSLIWDDEIVSTEKNKRLNMHIPPPSVKLPGHNESYNPPDEYLLSEEEKKAWELLDPEDRPFNFVPQKYEKLRRVPGYDKFIEERFERCLDLFLCPRAVYKRPQIDPESLLPKLPNPKDLMPFPTMLSMKFEGHTDKVRSISLDPTGQWLASGSDDFSVKLWEIASGRCLRTWKFTAPVVKVVFNPNPNIPIILAIIGKVALVINPEVGDETRNKYTNSVFDGEIFASTKKTYVSWAVPGKKEYPAGVKMVITHSKFIDHATWHQKGDYFATVCSKAVKTAVLIHRLSQKQTQNPFKKHKGEVQCVAFHPIRPFLFVATQRNIRVYNLTQQALIKKMLAGTQCISSISIHPGGDNLIIGSYDKRVCWFDMDYSSKPYRILKYHTRAVRAVAYHTRYPLFASCSDDGATHIFHGMVYNDLLQNPLLVPVKILKGHTVVDDFGIMDCVFHPTQPWIVTSGADGQILLYT